MSRDKRLKYRANLRRELEHYLLLEPSSKFDKFYLREGLYHEFVPGSFQYQDSDQDKRNKKYKVYRSECPCLESVAKD